MASLDALNALHQMKQKLKGQLVNAWSSGHGFRRCVANRCRFGRAPANRTVAAAFSPPSFGFMLSSRSERLSASRGTSLRFCFAASGPAFSRALKASISLGRSRIRVLASLLSIALAFLLAPASRGQSKRPSNPDTECLSCHAQPDLKSASGHSVFVNAAKHQASVHAILNCTSCHTDVSGFPHTARIKKVDCAACHSDEAASVPASIHAVLGAQSCTDCHGSAHDTRSALSLLPQICNSCHTAEVKDFLASAHGAARKAGDPRSPTCETCHGSIHKIVSASDQASPVAKKISRPLAVGAMPIRHSSPAIRFLLRIRSKATKPAFMDAPLPPATTTPPRARTAIPPTPSIRRKMPARPSIIGMFQVLVPPATRKSRKPIAPAFTGKPSRMACSTRLSAPIATAITLFSRPRIPARWLIPRVCHS